MNIQRLLYAWRFISKWTSILFLLRSFERLSGLLSGIYWKLVSVSRDFGLSLPPTELVFPPFAKRKLEISFSQPALLEFRLKQIQISSVAFQRYIKYSCKLVDLRSTVKPAWFQLLIYVVLLQYQVLNFLSALNTNCTKSWFRVSTENSAVFDNYVIFRY